MAKEGMAAEVINYGSNAVIAADPKVVALSDVMGEHNLGPFADASESGEEHVAFEVLCFVYDDKCIGNRATADVGERENLEQLTADYFIDNLGTGDGFKRVGDGSCPR